MAGDALARNSAADRAERERRITEENHWAENWRFLVERTDDIEIWFAGRGGLTGILPDLRDAFDGKTRSVFLRTGDLAVSQNIAFADLRREGFKPSEAGEASRYPERDPDGNPFDPDRHLPDRIGRPRRPDPEDYVDRPLGPALPEDGPSGENNSLPHKPGWVWEDGAWRQETPEEASRRGAQNLARNASSDDEGGGGGEGGGPDGGEGDDQLPAGTDAPGSDKEKENGEPEEAQAPTEPGEDGEDGTPKVSKNLRDLGC